MRKIIIATHVILWTIFVSISASAQTVIQADLTQIQPQIIRDDIGFKSCGIRAVVIVASPKIVVAYDFSLMFNSEHLYGMIKAGKIHSTLADMTKGGNKSSVVKPAPVGYWIAKATDGKSLKPIKVIPAENAGYILGVADMLDTTKIIESILNGDPMQFALRYADQNFEHIIGFSGSLPEKERAPLDACIDGALARAAAVATKNLKDSGGK